MISIGITQIDLYNKSRQELEFESLADFREYVKTQDNARYDYLVARNLLRPNDYQYDQQVINRSIHGITRKIRGLVK